MPASVHPVCVPKDFVFAHEFIIPVDHVSCMIPIPNMSLHSQFWLKGRDLRHLSYLRFKIFFYFASLLHLLFSLSK